MKGKRARASLGKVRIHIFNHGHCIIVLLHLRIALRARRGHQYALYATRDTRTHAQTAPPALAANSRPDSHRLYLSAPLFLSSPSNLTHESPVQQHTHTTTAQADTHCTHSHFLLTSPAPHFPSHTHRSLVASFPHRPSRHASLSLSLKSFARAARSSRPLKEEGRAPRPLAQPSLPVPPSSALPLA